MSAGDQATDPRHAGWPASEQPREVDLLVIGGGVNGAGIARDAAGRGLSVLVCEKGDIAEGTSSRSGKLIHGGLRYLEYYEFRLVREALIEREVLLESAPHIIWPMRFVLPHDKGLRPAWLVRLGLFLYDHLGGRKRLPGTRTLNLKSDPEGKPLKDGYTKAFEYSDCWVDDARLVVLNALDAQRLGATVLTRTRFVGARRESGGWLAQLADVRSGATLQVRARAIVNSAGPWVEQVLQGVPQVENLLKVRLVKGSHIIVPKFWDGPQAYLVQNTDKRVIFINPYEGHLALIGTTDIPYDGDADAVQIASNEIDYLCDVVNRYFKSTLSPRDLQRALALGDKAMIGRAPGVGPKLALRLTPELKDKAPAMMLRGEGGEAGPVHVAVPRGPEADAVAALVKLGYSESTAATAVARAANDLGDAEAGALIRDALRNMGK